MLKKYKMILIGGSAGSFSVIIKILKGIPKNFKVPIVIIVHRQKNVVSEMDKILSLHTKGRKIVEPEDKQGIEPGCIYLAPQNYHLLFEDDHTFSLDYSEAVNFSRPAIDVTFESAAMIFKENVLAIMLSGSNDDGSLGSKAILDNGGYVVVQDPETADYKVMPDSTKQLNPVSQILTPDKIVTLVANSF